MQNQGMIYGYARIASQCMVSLGSLPRRGFFRTRYRALVMRRLLSGVRALGAGWGIADLTALRGSKPGHLFSTVAELREFQTDEHP